MPIAIRLLTGRVTPERSVVYAEPPFADGNVGIPSHAPLGPFVLEVKQCFAVGMRACWPYGQVLIPVRAVHVLFQRSLAQGCHLCKADGGGSGTCDVDVEDEDWVVEEGRVAAG